MIKQMKTSENLALCIDVNECDEGTAELLLAVTQLVHMIVPVF